jgi:hydroxymethylpyrimidine/phosphomethylpyrimidine kinase
VTVPNAVPNALTIAGSDPSGGAGIQADLKTFSALGAYGCAVLTALTAQNTRGVRGVHLVPPAFVTQQLETLVDDVRIDAVKIGMLATADIARAVRDFLDAYPVDVVVLDPVMVATSGDRLLDDEAVEAVRELVPRASLVTPNLPEAAARLLETGARRVLLKGGHLAGDPVDVLAGPDGVLELPAARVTTANTHGTGCSLSSAVAALRPQRPGWAEAVGDAKRWLTAAIAASGELDVGSGHGPVHHFHATWRRPGGTVV